MKNQKGKIWISTQIVEASLDIDYDYLFTELSTADSLFQRMGDATERESTIQINLMYLYIPKIQVE